MQKSTVEMQLSSVLICIVHMASVVMFASLLWISLLTKIRIANNWIINCIIAFGWKRNWEVWQNSSTAGDANCFLYHYFIISALIYELRLWFLLQYVFLSFAVNENKLIFLYISFQLTQISCIIASVLFPLFLQLFHSELSWWTVVFVIILLL